MSEIIPPLETLRERLRDLETEAVIIRARVEEVRELIAIIERGPRRKPGRPRKAEAEADILEMPGRVTGAAHTPEPEPEDAA